MKPIAERRAWKALRNRLIAAHEREVPRKSGKPDNHTYVIQVEAVKSKPHFEFYVGECAGSPDIRFAKHASGEKDQLAARMFRVDDGGVPLYRPVRLREDLMEGFPVFWLRKNAKMAEAEITRVLIELGYPAKSG
jgi:hypothetical protein